MPPEKKPTYMDTVEAMRRFERLRPEAERRKKEDILMGTLPQGHGSGLNADMVDGLHAEDFLEDIRANSNNIKMVGGGGGTVWYNGVGAPAAGVGVNGDYYLDTFTNELYTKAGNIWVVIATLGGGGVTTSQTFVTTIDLHQGVGSYDVATAAAQDVLIESLIFSPRLDVSDDAAITYVTFQTDTTTPQTFIDAAGGVKALLTAEAQIDWVGSVILRVGDKVQFTIAGGSADVNPTTCDVVIKYTVMVAGGSLV